MRARRGLVNESKYGMRGRGGVRTRRHGACGHWSLPHFFGSWGPASSNHVLLERPHPWQCCSTQPRLGPQPLSTHSWLSNSSNPTTHRCGWAVGWLCAALWATELCDRRHFESPQVVCPISQMIHSLPFFRCNPRAQRPPTRVRRPPAREVPTIGTSH